MSTLDTMIRWSRNPFGALCLWILFAAIAFGAYHSFYIAFIQTKSISLNYYHDYVYAEITEIDGSKIHYRYKIKGDEFNGITSDINSDRVNVGDSLVLLFDYTDSENVKIVSVKSELDDFVESLLLPDNATSGLD